MKAIHIADIYRLEQFVIFVYITLISYESCAMQWAGWYIFLYVQMPLTPPRCLFTTTSTLGYQECSCNFTVYQSLPTNLT
jgi:hypothetical protein